MGRFQNGRLGRNCRVPRVDLTTNTVSTANLALDLSALRAYFIETEEEFEAIFA